MNITIYSLRDPITGLIRYIGRTKNSIHQRCSHHIYYARTGENIIYKDRWINKLLKLGYKPIIEVVDELNCTWDESHEIEKWYMSLFRSWGFRLTNSNEKITTMKKDSSIAVEASKKKVYQYSLEGNFISEFSSAREAANETESSFRMISSCCNLKRASTNNFMWRFDRYNKIDKYLPQKRNGGGHTHKKYKQKQSSMCAGR